MKRIPLIIILLIMASFAFSQTKLTVTKSTIKFQIKNLGINTGGTINGLQANIQFNPALLTTSTIEATADVTTINTDNDKRDEHLRSDEFFDVQRYPKIAMKAISVKRKSGDNYTGQFSVTIKDKTKLFDIPFTYTETGNTANIKGSFKLNRLDFGVGGKSLVLSNEVTVTMEIEGSK